MVKKIAIAGLGTVGAHTLRIIQNMPNKHFDVVGVSANNQHKKRVCDISNIAFFTDAIEMLEQTKPDIIVELIGGSSGIAEKLWQRALDMGIDIVTANKALMAEKGKAMIAIAREKNLMIAYGASVAGAIPTVRCLREAVSGTHINQVSGILNGTCNYILSQMRNENADFNDVLKTAQQLGYAEADPTFDVDGIDAGHKILILGAVAFGHFSDISDIDCRGIRNISLHDIKAAKNMGYRIKLIANAYMQESQLKLTVRPYFVPKSNPLYHVEDANNAVMIDGVESGPLTLIGAGAGGNPTASAVMSDLMSLAAGQRHIDILGNALQASVKHNNNTAQDLSCGYYIRINSIDRIGVLSEISDIFKQYNISIRSMTQYGNQSDQPVNLEFITHICEQPNHLYDAIDQLNQCDFILDKIILFPILEG